MVLGHLQDAGLKVKLARCAFCSEEVWYLGYVISSQGIAMAQWPRPRMVSELRTFLCFVEGFAKLPAPLYKVGAELIRGKSGECSQELTTVWSEKCEDIMQLFILEVEASHAGLGAALAQKVDGKVRPIAYASHSL